MFYVETRKRNASGFYVQELKPTKKNNWFLNEFLPSFNKSQNKIDFYTEQYITDKQFNIFYKYCKFIDINDLGVLSYEININNYYNIEITRHLNNRYYLRIKKDQSKKIEIYTKLLDEIDYMISFLDSLENWEKFRNWIDLLEYQELKLYYKRDILYFDNVGKNISVLKFESFKDYQDKIYK